MHYNSNIYINESAIRIDDKMDPILAFLYSLATYSCFQFFDISSTRIALSELELEKHEINPFLVFLNTKFGPKTSFFLMWLIIANAVALLDALYVQYVFGFTILCYFVGMFHLLATFNNLQIYYETRFVGADNFERNTEFLIRELKKRTILGKVALLTKLNLFNVFLSVFGFIALILSAKLLSVLEFRLVEQTNLFLIYFPPMMILALILFFPIKVFGMFLISRRLHSSKSVNLDSQVNYSSFVNVPVGVLETALKDAKTNDSAYVQFRLTREEES